MMNKSISIHRVISASRALVVGAMLVLATTLSLAPSKADAAVTIPISVHDFDGTFTINSFATQAVNGVNQLVAIGTLQGTQKKGPKGALNPVAIGGVAVPAAIGSGTTCPILHLDLGPLHLDLLGLNIDLSEVILDITAVPGAGALLGNLLCDVAGLLDPNSLTGLVALLNQILDLLG